jgi:aryl-alcohol dehydrogenase-like predicted oxidoreductase
MDIQLETGTLPETVTINGQVYRRCEDIDTLFTPDSYFERALNLSHAIRHIAEQAGCTRAQAAWAFMIHAKDNPGEYPSEF